MNTDFFKLVLGAWAWMTLGSLASAAPIVPPGIQGKTTAGAGTTVSRASGALFYNPANVIYTAPQEVAFDVSYASVRYSYDHIREDYAPVVVPATATPITLGYSRRPTDKFAFGFSLYPTGVGGEQMVLDVPLEISREPVLTDVKSKDLGLVSAIGGSVRLSREAILGFGVIHTFERRSLMVYEISEEKPFLEANYRGSFFQPIVGVRSEWMERRLTLGASWRPSISRRYSGSLINRLSGQDEKSDIVAVAFDPMVIATGAEWNFPRLGVFFDYRYEAHKEGASKVRGGLLNDPPMLDLVNTHNYALGARGSPIPNHLITLAVGLYPAIVGTGERPVDPNAGPAAIGGVRFGSLEHLPRQVISLGYRLRNDQGSYGEFSLYNLHGKRDVALGFPGEGTYELRALLASLGVGMAL